MGESQDSGSVGQPWGRLALASGVLCVLTRVPFAAHRLWDHDSIQFALGVEKYDLAAHHPHPPGYPLYIALLKLLAALGISPLQGMVGFAILMSGVGAALFPLLVARWTRVGPAGASGDERPEFGAALLAAALYIFNPLLWFYGELPLLYAVEGALSVGLAYAATRMHESARACWIACAAFALAAGLRPSTVVLLAPLFLWGLMRAWRDRAIGRRALAGGLLLGVTLVLSWALPMLHLAGGLAAYRRINSEHFAALLPSTSILYGAGVPALLHNLRVLAKWALQGCFPGVIVLGVLLAFSPARWRGAARALRTACGRICLWALPPILFFAFFHVTKAGYTLVHLPALLAAIALVAGPLLARSPLRLWTAAGSAALLGASLFLFGGERRADEPAWRTPFQNEFHPTDIRAYERDLDRVLETVRRFPARETVLATVELEGTAAGEPKTFLYPWHRHLQWFLPEYETILLVPEQRLAEIARGHAPFVALGTEIPVPASTRRLVFVLAGPTGDRLTLPPGEVLFQSDRFLVASATLPADGVVGPFRLRAPGSPLGAVAGHRRRP